MRDTEFGGGAGSPSRLPDGSGRDLSAGEKARVARIALMRDTPSTTTPRNGSRFEVLDGVLVEYEVPYQPDVNAIAEMRERTNRYSDDAESMSDGV